MHRPCHHPAPLSLVTLVTYTSIHHVKLATQRRQPLAVHTTSSMLAATYKQSNRATATGTHTMATETQQHDGIRDAQLRLPAPCQQHHAKLLPPNPPCHPITPPSCSPCQAARARPGRGLVAYAVTRPTRKAAQAHHRRPPMRRCRKPPATSRLPLPRLAVHSIAARWVLSNSTVVASRRLPVANPAGRAA
jgi:hypothetical protein